MNVASLAGLRDSMIPVTRGGRILAAGAMVDSLCSGLFLGAATLYFVGLVHLPATQVAGAMSAAVVASAFRNLRFLVFIHGSERRAFAL